MIGSDKGNLRERPRGVAESHGEHLSRQISQLSAGDFYAARNAHIGAKNSSGTHELLPPAEIGSQGFTFHAGTVDKFTGSAAAARGFLADHPHASMPPAHVFQSAAVHKGEGAYQSVERMLGHQSSLTEKMALVRAIQQQYREEIKTRPELAGRHADMSDLRVGHQLLRPDNFASVMQKLNHAHPELSQRVLAKLNGGMSGDVSQPGHLLQQPGGLRQQPDDLRQQPGDIKTGQFRQDQGPGPGSDRPSLRQGGDRFSFYAHQDDAKSCSAFSLAMMSSDWQTGRPPAHNQTEYFKRLTGTTEHGYRGSLETMADQIRSQGLNSKAYDYGMGNVDGRAMNDLNEELAQGHTAVVKVINPHTGNPHYMYVAGRDKNGDYIVGDPDRKNVQHYGPVSGDNLLKMMHPRNGFVAGWSETQTAASRYPGSAAYRLAQQQSARMEGSTAEQPRLPDQQGGADQSRLKDGAGISHPEGIAARATALAHSIADHALHVAHAIGSVGQCARGVRQALERVGLHFHAPNAVAFGRQLENSGLFERVNVPLHQAQRGDIIVRNWSAATQRAHYGQNHGDVVVVTGRNLDGTLRGANDHINHAIAADGGRYQGSYVLRAKGAQQSQQERSV